MAPMLTSAERVLQKRAEESAEVLSRRRSEMAAELDSLLDSLTAKVGDVRRAIAATADSGADAASRKLQLALEKGRKGVHQLEEKWDGLDTRQKAGVIAGLVAALAAAVATPTIVRKVRESRHH